MGERVVLTFLTQNPRRREPVVAYRVEEGGIGNPLGGRGQIGSWQPEFQEHVLCYLSQIEDLVEPGELEHGTEVCTLTFSEGDASPHAEPQVEWHLEQLQRTELD